MQLIIKYINTIVILICLHLSSITHAQTWFPVGAKWYSPNITLDANLFDVAGYGYNKFEVEKDTLVLGLSSKVISAQNMRYDGVEQSYVRNKFIVREEGNKVYHYRNNTFELIFDFNLSEGDTLPYKNPYDCDSMSLVIDSIKMINVSGEVLQKQYVSSVGHILGYGDTVRYEIIEKIGVLNFIEWAPMSFNNTHWCSTPEPYGSGFSYLRCYIDNEISYSSGSDPCDTLIVLVGNEKIDTNNDIELIPNPATNYLKILNNQEVLSISIIDPSGQLILKKNYESELDFNLPEGLYFVTIQLKSGKEIIKKLIVKK